VKVALHQDRLVNVSIEYEDVAALAAELELPVKEVLRAATAAAQAAYPVSPAGLPTPPGAAPPLWG
jgi:uncharacterized protein (DUF111 family)